MKEKFLSRACLNIFNKVGENDEVLLGIKKNKLYYEKLENLGNILITTQTGYGKTNILKNIISTFIGDMSKEVVILEEKNIEFRNIEVENVKTYLGNEVEEGLNYIIKDLNKDKLEDKKSDKIIVIDDLSSNLREKDGVAQKIETLLCTCNAVGWTVIMSSQSLIVNSETIINNFKTIIAAKTPIKEIAQIFPEKQQRLNPGEAFFKTESEFIRLSILYAKDI